VNGNPIIFIDVRDKMWMRAQNHVFRRVGPLCVCLSCANVRVWQCTQPERMLKSEPPYSTTVGLGVSASTLRLPRYTVQCLYVLKCNSANLRVRTVHTVIR
jgi:hypothetical protein